MVRTIQLGMAGCGTVGAGVARLIDERRQALADRYGFELRIAKVLVRDLAKSRQTALAGELFTDDVSQLLKPNIDMVVEVIGGCNVARKLVCSALEAGRPVVTANKALLAEFGGEVFRAAAASGVGLGIEASCCAGLPVICAIDRGLAANRIESLLGIVNGTCNYILTAMSAGGVGFDTSLAEAQSLGYAEADPTLDVNGTDSAHKLLILASLAFGCQISLDAVPCRGIESLQTRDLMFGAGLGFVCKLLAIAQRLGDEVMLGVEPVFLAEGHPLALVNGGDAGLCLLGHASGPVVVHGSGAGAGSTASAVVSDIIDLSRGNNRPVAFPIDDGQSVECRPLDDLDARFYCRVRVKESAASKAQVAQIWADQGVVLVSEVRHEVSGSDGAVDMVTLTNAMPGATLRQALQRIAELDTVIGQPVAVRIVEA